MHLLEKEMDYWGIEHEQINQEKYDCSFLQSETGRKLAEMLKQDPQEDWPDLHDSIAEQWRNLGPLSLEAIHENGNIDMENKLEY